MADHASPRVAVCVATFRRPEGLRRTLEGLAALAFKATGPRPQITVVVVDNDAAATAGPVCRAIAPTHPWELRYRVEPTRGISQARNTALEVAGQGHDFIAFVDDDEVPRPDWLAALLTTCERHAADVATGPVLAHFPQTPPPWAASGSFHSTPPRATGTSPEHCATNNVLVAMRVVRMMGPRPFDESLGLIGGEDTDFFARAAAAGWRIVWSADAVVDEWVAPARASVRWVARRAFRGGNGYSAARIRTGGHGARARRVAVGAARLGQGLLLLLLPLPVGAQRRVDGIRLMALGAGSLTSLVGHRYAEYRLARLT